MLPTYCLPEENIVKQLVATSQGEVQLREAPMPRLEGSGAIVQTVCSVFGAGSELGGLRRQRQAVRQQEQARDRPITERPMSYQSCGRIVELSDDLQGAYQVGDLVACSGGGFGAHAEYGYAPRHTIARVPEGLSPEEAATTNVGLTALHALRRAQFQAGETLAIIGLGMVGQCLAQLVTTLGGRAFGADLYPLRLERAKRCGIEAAIDARSADFLPEVRRRTDGLGADYVALCVVGSNQELVHLAVRLLRPSGVLLLVGGPLHPDFGGAEGDASPHVKEIDVRWVYGRGPGSRDPQWNQGATEYPSRFVRWTAQSNLEALLRLQAAGRLRTAPLLTHRFPLERVTEAADLLIERPEEALGVALTYGP